ncbi:hypothetical protein [Bradyrhizobium sp. WSM3983]|uniref:hypothetical protein n=1 Tax=Bradyrhizobium sp. WSM3983 TaxID=1038867 RepID=UPI0003F5866A|nr:hypothetical protein [Bradyrhizobium sp. WSM3983]
MSFFAARRALALGAFVALALANGTRAEEAAEEPTSEDCAKVLAKAREMTNSLSPKSLSRHFANGLLTDAQTEADNGEFDGCVEYAEKAVDEVANRKHWLAPGEIFRVSTVNGYVELSGDDP